MVELATLRRYDASWQGDCVPLSDSELTAVCSWCGRKLYDPARAWIGEDRTGQVVGLYCARCLPPAASWAPAPRRLRRWWAGLGHDLGAPLVGAVIASPLGLLLLWATLRLEAHMRATLGPAAFTEDPLYNLRAFALALPVAILVLLAICAAGALRARRRG